MVGCAEPEPAPEASPLVGDTVTEAGTWRLVLGETTYDQGKTALELDAADADSDEPAPGLHIFARPGMEAMTHDAVAEFADVGGGHYFADFVLDMPGLWTITGYAGPGEALESLTVVIEVRP